MIIFDLQCACGCQFEGWFTDREDYYRQSCEGLLVCPHCGSDDVHKIMSPVAYHSGTPLSESPAVKSDEIEVTPEMAMQFLRSVRDYVEKNFEDVGPKMAEESLRIHYGVAEPRYIRGVTTAAEDKMLADEGIELLKIPVLKKTSDPKLN